MGIEVNFKGLFEGEDINVFLSWQKILEPSRISWLPEEEAIRLMVSRT